jgi:hypothetical protein
LMFSCGCLNWLLIKTSSNSTTTSTTRRTMRVVPSTHVGRIREKVWPEFRSRLAARPTSLKIGALFGFMWRLTCRRFLATPDQLIVSTPP